MATATAAKAPRTLGAKAKARTWTTDLWTVALLERLNVHLKAQGQRLIPLTQNNIDNFERIMTVEVGGQQGGFLRDNNPLNVGTFCGQHGPLYGAAKTIAPFGPDARCSGQSVYLNVFATPMDGVEGTYRYLVQYGQNLISVLQQDGHPALFAGASPWGSGDVSATPLKESASGTSGGIPSAIQQGPYFAQGQGFTTTLSANEQRLANEFLTVLSQGGQLPKELKADLRALPAARRTAVFDYVFATIRQSRNLSLLQQAEAAAGGIVSGVSGVASGTVGGIEAIGSFFARLGSLDWKRVGIFLGGAALVVTGLAVYVSTSAGPKVLERIP